MQPADAALARRYAESLLDAASCTLPGAAAVVEAFAAVPRERFAGPPPWRVIGCGPGAFDERTDDPRRLYRNALVALDEATGINNGEPRLWAVQLAGLGPLAGARILQVGAGGGYYTAILAALAGPAGRVEAFESEPRLARRAGAALAGLATVTLHHGDATRAAPARLDLVVAFAGVTHPARPWCDALAPAGRMLLPVTGRDGQGVMGLFARAGEDFTMEARGRCAFYPCHGARMATPPHVIDRLIGTAGRVAGWHARCGWRGEAFRYDAPQP